MGETVVRLVGVVDHTPRGLLISGSNERPKRLGRIHLVPKHKRQNKTTVLHNQLVPSSLGHSSAEIGPSIRTWAGTNEPEEHLCQSLHEHVE